jgi:predicted ATPase
MGAALSAHDEIVRSAIEASTGNWVKHTGDGVLAVFSDVSNAVNAAVEIQRSLKDLDEMRVRIGLHTGEAERRGDDYFGLTVSAAARVMDAGHGGQVLVSEVAKAGLDSSLDEDLALMDLGVHRLRDLGEPQRLYQVSGPGLDEDFPPLRTLDLVDHNLPVQLTSFVGREEALAEVKDLVSSHRLVTLTGVGGAGKTRLSLQAAAEMIDDFPDGVRLVQLAQVSDPDAVPVALAAAVGVRHERGSAEGVVKRLVDYLRDMEMLVVVDNCEHVLGAAASLISTLLSDTRNVSVLASSREGLSLHGERIWQVPSLDTSSNEVQSECSRLFMDRASAVAPQLAWNDQTKTHIDRICELLDGIPLAVELAAARTRVLSLSQIVERLEDRFRLLTGGSRGALPRQQTLEATVDWSYQLLSEAERNLFDRTSVFVGGFTIEAAEASCTDEQIDVADVLDLLTGLVDKSMVVAEHGDAGVVRYRLLETLRQYGLRRLAEEDEIGVWKTRHLKYFVIELEERGILNWISTDNLPFYAAEQGNLAAAIDWARIESVEGVPLLATALSELHFSTLGDPEESLTFIDEALASGEADVRLTLRMRGHRLRLLASLGRVDEFEADWRDLHTELDGVGDEEAVWCLARAAGVYGSDPQLDASTAVPLAREAVRRSVDLAPKARYVVQMILGWVLIWTNADFGEISTAFRTAVDLAKEEGDPQRVEAALAGSVEAARTADQRDGTHLASDLEDDLLDEWNEGGRSTHDHWIVWVAIRRGMWDLAEEELSVLDVELKGQRRWMVLMPRAALRWMQGRYEEAEEDLDAMMKFGQARRWHHDYYPTRAEVAAARGDLGATQQWVQRHCDFPLDPAEELMRLGTMRALVMAYVDAGEVEAAKSELAEMREISKSHTQLRGPIVQTGSEEFYLAAAEAELTRVHGPEPEAWARAEGLSFWGYWTLYCGVRKLEAQVANGENVTDEIAKTREEVTSLGAGGLVSLLDEFSSNSRD